MSRRLFLCPVKSGNWSTKPARQLEVDDVVSLQMVAQAQIDDFSSIKVYRQRFELKFLRVARLPGGKVKLHSERVKPAKEILSTIYLREEGWTPVRVQRNVGIEGDDKMKRRCWTMAPAVLLIAVMALGHAAQPDFEVTGPDGRSILLKGDGTWRYADAEDKERPKDKPKEAGEAVLQLDGKTEAAGGCRFALRLANDFPYEIRQIVPAFSAHRQSGVVYDSVTTGFFSIKPGNSQTQEVLFRGIPCQAIARLQVVGGDRCQMGDLDRFALDPGKCLARIRVKESDLVRFDK